MKEEKDFYQLEKVIIALKEKIDELERWKKVTVGRELRIRELKDKIKKLEAEHG